MGITLAQYAAHSDAPPLGVDDTELGMVLEQAEELWAAAVGADHCRFLVGGSSQGEVSATIAKDMKKRGFKFCGPTIVYAFMQATGLVNDHLVTCHRHGPCAAMG